MRRRRCSRTGLARSVLLAGLVSLAGVAVLVGCSSRRASPSALPAVATPSAPATASPAATATAPASAADPLVAAAGDIACPGNPPVATGGGGASGCRATATADVLSALEPALVLALGDEQYDVASPAEFRAGYDASWGRLKAITRPAPGNHEYATAGASGYFGYFGDAAGPADRGYYSLNVGTWHVVALNSNCRPAGGCGAGSPQERWLRADLAAHPSVCTLAFWHHPRFSSGLHGDDSTVGPLWNALYDAGAELVLAGHDHDYERWAPMSPAGELDQARGIREFVVGTGGRSLYPILRSPRPGSEARSDAAYGVLALSLHPTGYDWSFRAAAGSSYADTGSGSCH